MEGLFCEIIGKIGAVCNGVGGSQHIKRENYFSTGIQGESVPVATGVAYDLKQKSTKKMNKNRAGIVNKMKSQTIKFHDIWSHRMF